MIKLPDICLRNNKDCSPYSQVVADDRTSFFCCGYLEKGERTLEQDAYRLCFKNGRVDEINDNDKRDLITQAKVILDALHIIENEKENENE